MRPDQRGREASGAGPDSARESALAAIRMAEFYLKSDSYSDALTYFARVESGELVQSLSSAEAVALHAGMARCHLGLGRHDDARQHADRVAELGGRADDPVAVSEAQVILARVEAKSGRFRKSLRAAERAYAVLRARPDSALLAEASKALGTAHAELGNVTAARDCFIDCLVCNRRIGNEEGAAGAYNNLGILAKRSGDLTSAVDYFERALEIDRKLGRPASVARRLNNLGVALYRLSRWSEAQKHLKQAWEIYTRLGATRDVVAVESALGNICRVRRDWRGAKEYFTRVLRVSQEAGYLRAEALALEFLGDLEKDRGNYDESLRVLNQALSRAHRLSSRSDVVGEVLRRRAEVFAALGRLDEAERDCTQALDLCRRISDRLEEGATLRVLAGVSYARGRRSAARVLSGRAQRVLGRTGESFELAMTALTDGIGLRADSGADGPALDEIEGRFSDAERLFERMGSTYWASRCRMERARALLAAGHTGRGRSWAERARAGIAETGEERDVAELDALMSEFDRELAAAGAAPSSRYSAIAEASLCLRSGDTDSEALHRFALQAAEVASADRLVLFRRLEDGAPQVVMSVGHTGRRLAEVRRFVREAVSDGSCERPLVAAAGATTAGRAPRPVAAVALLPTRLEGDGAGYLLYADRLKGDGAHGFTSSDVEFLSAAVPILAALHSACAAPPESEEGARDGESSAFITRDPAMLRLLAGVERLRDSGIPVLVLGESGVGKDVLARLVHKSGRTRVGSLVVLNSGAVPQHLQESELFGHVKGAFTDADRDRPGLVEAAHDGTLFLDEIGDMSPDLQVKLLRFLQSGEYRRVGESLIRKSNARVISASNRDLRQEVEAGRFRRDLYYRLSAFVVEVPPLRERQGDIPLLMEHFLALYSELENKDIAGFGAEVIELFCGYDWRGNNVRELENEVRRCVALCDDGEEVTLDHVSPQLLAMRGAVLESPAPGEVQTLKAEVEALEKSRIREALARANHSKRDAAEHLGMSRTGLYTKMKKYGMS